MFTLLLTRHDETMLIPALLLTGEDAESDGGECQESGYVWAALPTR